MKEEPFALEGIYVNKVNASEGNIKPDLDPLNETINSGTLCKSIIIIRRHILSN